MSLRVNPDIKAMLMRAATCAHTDLTDFVLRNAIQAAKKIISEEEHFVLSGRDSLRVLDALENPPAPNERLMAAAKALPTQ
jgi:uncharacterized protein (DUF1778 family)